VREGERLELDPLLEARLLVPGLFAIEFVDRLAAETGALEYAGACLLVHLAGERLLQRSPCSTFLPGRVQSSSSNVTRAISRPGVKQTPRAWVVRFIGGRNGIEPGDGVAPSVDHHRLVNHRFHETRSFHMGRQTHPRDRGESAGHCCGRLWKAGACHPRVITR